MSNLSREGFICVALFFLPLPLYYSSPFERLGGSALSRERPHRWLSGVVGAFAPDAGDTGFDSQCYRALAGFFFFLFFFLPGIEAPSPGIRFWAICLKKVASSFHSLLVPFPCERFG